MQNTGPAHRGSTMFNKIQPIIMNVHAIVNGQMKPISYKIPENATFNTLRRYLNSAIFTNGGCILQLNGANIANHEQKLTNAGCERWECIFAICATEHTARIQAEYDSKS